MLVMKNTPKEHRKTEKKKNGKIYTRQILTQRKLM